MSNVNFVNPRARFLDSNGDPLTSGVVRFYEAGTSTLKDVYLGPDTLSLASNPNTLNSEGYVEESQGVWLGEGRYDIEVRNSLGGLEWTYQNVQGSISTGAGEGNVGYVDSLTELRNLDAGAFDRVYVSGHTTAADGGARWMKWSNTDVQVDNNGTVVTPVSAPAVGRWVWEPDGADVFVTPQLFGAFPSDGSLIVDSQFAQMISWVSANGKYENIRINLTGTYWIEGDITFSSGNATVDPGVDFKTPSGSQVVRFVNDSVKIYGTNAVTFPAPSGASTELNIFTSDEMEVDPRWWNITSTGDQGYAFSRLVSGISGDIDILVPINFTLGSQSIGMGSINLISRVGASISMEGCELSVAGVIMENFTTPLFTGPDIDRLDFQTDYCSTRWVRLDNAGVIRPEINGFITNNTNSGARDFRIIWEKQINGTDPLDLQTDITANARGDQFHLRVIHEFRGQQIRTTGATIEFGEVTSDGPFISSASDDYSMRFLCDQEFSWYGNKGSILSLGDEFQLAYTNNCLSNTPNNEFNIEEGTWLNLGGYYEIPRVSIPADTSTKERAKIKNGYLKQNGSLPGAWLSLYYGAVFKDVYLESQVAATVLLTSTINNFSCYNSTLEGKSGLIINSDTTNTKSHDFINSIGIINENTTATLAGISVSGGIVNFRGSELYRNPDVGLEGITTIVSNGAVLNMTECYSEYSVEHTGACGIYNNRFNKAYVTIQDPLNSKIVDNSFITNDDIDVGVYFRPTIASFTIFGLQVHGNTFIDGVSNPLTRTDYKCIDVLSGTGSFASSGHKCIIKDNFINPNYLRAMVTEMDLEFNISLTIAAGVRTITTDLSDSATGNLYFFKLLDDANNPTEVTHHFLNDNVGGANAFPQCVVYDYVPTGTSTIYVKNTGASTFGGDLKLKLVASNIGGNMAPGFTIV